MSFEIIGETKNLSPSEKKALQKLYRRKLSADEIISVDLAREICQLAESLRQMIGLLVDRQGNITEVILGTKQIIYLPDLGRFKSGTGRLRGLRFLFSDLSKHEMPKIPSDIYTDIEKLRLDAVVGVKAYGRNIACSYAYLKPAEDLESSATQTEVIKNLSNFELDFRDFIFEIEAELQRHGQSSKKISGSGAVLVGVYDKRIKDYAASMEELKELARSAGMKISDSIVQRREPDPKTLIGRGKLEELVLRCLRLDATHLVFDTELRPAQWRTIVNQTDLKVLDRSMLILDIFAQRASSADGRLQVELAQLKYNLPRLTEEDSGLSRLSGGIGGRGPGETKLEVSRRRARDRISDLEKRIKRVSVERGQRRERRKESDLPLISILGYTNVGKSTLFNLLTKGGAFVENKLFATLEPTVRKLVFPSTHDDSKFCEYLMSDTVGFIRHLPKELVNAFKATLEELESADLFLHVLDISDPEIETRKKAVEMILGELGLEKIPTLHVLNKADLVNDDIIQNLQDEYDGSVVSAKSGKGILELKARIEDKLSILE